MKIIWSDFASDMLKEIYKYYKKEANIRVAKRIKRELFSSTKPLNKNPKLGQIELYLEQLNEGHRYLIEGNYKIIYKQVKEGILITDVFHTRQDPIELERNKS